MPSVLVPLAEGFEEIEAVTIVDVLRRAGVGVTTAALDDLSVKGAHGIRIRADTSLPGVIAEGAQFDAVVLPGGMPGSAHLRDDERVHGVLRACAERGGIVAAICAAPIALEAAGLLEGRLATAYPGFREELRSARDTTDARVVEDGPVITSGGPGTALEFALRLVARLTSTKQSEELRRGMLVG